jgi:Icc-related predicted phosphoesterase
MRIIYIADIHGAFDRIGQLLDATDADTYIIGGDLIDLPFYTMNTAMHYHDLQTYFHGLRRRMNKPDDLLEDFVDRLLLTPDLPDDIQEKGARFQQYTIRARRVMQQKYKVLENILSLKTEAPCFCLPGNYDMDLKYTSLHHRDLHLQSRFLGHLNISGYGGAGGWTQGIPERYVIRSRSNHSFSERDHEMIRFFEAAQPDLIVTHQPAHGFHDQVTPMGETGSAALLNYCETHDVLACLTGHIHEQWGFAESEGTIYLNPSNFGDVAQISGRVAEGGFFHEIEVDKKRIEHVTYKKLAGRAIYDIMVYDRHEDAWQSRVVDKGRYGAHLRGQTYDHQTASGDHASVPEWSGDAQTLYRDSLVDIGDAVAEPVKEALRTLETRENLPFSLDIVGSAHDGLNDSQSELDLVLYLRCGKSDAEKTCFRGSFSDCPHFAAAWAMLRECIGPRIAFEIVDCIDLNHVERSIRTGNYECEMTQRFVVYRSMGHPLHAAHLAQTEDLLSRNSDFRQELDGSIRSYFRIFMTTAGRIPSFSTYESHLHAIGIRLPGAMRARIRAYLERRHAEGDRL